MERYFDKLPTIIYNNLSVRDLTRRVKLDEGLRQQVQLFYPVNVPVQLRPDQISEAYYRDPSLDWLIFLTNEIIDPYYAWPMEDQEFDQMIVNRYGDAETAKQKVKYYRLNWPSDDKQIVKAYYDTLPDVLKKYYDPIFNARGQIQTYSRKQDDFTISTNKLVQFAINITLSDTQFVNSEFIDIKYSGETIGTAEIVTANTEQITIQHVSGNTTANSTYIVDVVGETSGAQTTSNTSVILYQPLTDDEAAYWQTVSFWDWEHEKNEQNKHIVLLEQAVIPDVLEQLRKKMS